MGVQGRKIEYEVAIGQDLCERLRVNLRLLLTSDGDEGPVLTGPGRLQGSNAGR